MEDITGRRDLAVKVSGAPNDDALSHTDVSSSSTLTFDLSSGAIEIDDNKSTSEETETMPKLIESLEPEKSKKNMKFNLRKSLAWDSAFFTSDGVLDADELTTMIEGGDKGKHCLPGIEEEVYQSMDSISTLESDNLSLDCLEAELFQDIRASIQNSNISNSSIKLSSGKRDSQPKVTTSPKKVDLDSGKQLGARIKDNKTSSIPQPKIISRVKPNTNSMSASIKRVSLSANNAKKDQDTAKQAQVTQKAAQTVKTTTKGSKSTGVTGPVRGVSKPLLNSKSSSLGTSTALKTDPARPSSSCSNSSGSSSGTDVKVKPSANILRKKVDSKTGKLKTTSIIPQTHSRINMKNKPPPVNSNLSSSISPASSISEWSSQSSSSTSFISQKSTSRTSINPTDRISNKKGDQSVAVHPSSQTGSVSRPPAVQPTGLKMPSPKIGFFDAGKSGARTPNGGIGVKYGNIRPPKTAAVATNMKPSQQQASKPETKTCHVSSVVSDDKTESNLNVCVKPSENVDDDSNKRAGFGSDAYEALSAECFVATDMKPSQQQQTSKPETKICRVTSDVSDHKTESSLNVRVKPSENVNDDSKPETKTCHVSSDVSDDKTASSLNVCVKLSENVDDDSNKRAGLGNDGYEALSSECFVTTDVKPSQQQQTSKPETKTCHITSDVSDHKTESSLNVCVSSSENVNDDSEKRAGTGSDGYEVLSSECLVATNMKPSQQQTSAPKTNTCSVTSVVLDHKTESSLSVCVKPSENVDDGSNKRAGLGSDGYELLSSECFVATDMKSSQQQSEQTSKPETKTLYVTFDVTDHKTESSLNVCVQPSENLDDDSNKRAGLESNSYEALSSECFVATNVKPSQQQETSKPETKACHVTFDASDHKTESSLNVCVEPSENVNDDSNKRAGLGNEGYEALSSECFVATDMKPSQQQTSKPETKICVKTSENVDDDSNKLDGEVLSSECFVATNMKPCQQQTSKPETESCLVTSDVSDRKRESSLNVCVQLSDNMNDDPNKGAGDGYEVLSSECFVTTNMKQSEQTSKPETKTCHVTSDVSDHKTESSLNVCVNLSKNVDDDDPNKRAGLGSDAYEALSAECFVATDMKPSQQQQTSKAETKTCRVTSDVSDNKTESSLHVCAKPSENVNDDSIPETKSCHVTSDVSDHKTESSLNVCVKPSENVEGDDSNKSADLGSDAYKALSAEYFVDTDMKPSQQQQTSKPEAKTCQVTPDVSDLKTESSLNISVKPSEIVHDDSNKRVGVGSDAYEAPSSECFVATNIKPSPQKEAAKPETKTCDVSDCKTESSLNVWVKPSENVDGDDSNKQAALGSDTYKALSAEYFAATGMKPSQQQQTSKTETKICHVTPDVSDLKTESSLNISVKSSENVDDDSNKSVGVGSDSYEAVSSKCLVATNVKPSQQQETSKPETKDCHVTFDDSDHKTKSSLNVCVEPSENVNDDSNKRAGLGNDGYEALSSECFVATDMKPFSQKEAAKLETKTCDVTSDVSDHKTESSFNVCVKPSENVDDDDDSNKRAGYEGLSSECFVATDMKLSQQQTSKPETKTCHVTSGVSDHKTESSLSVCVKPSENVDNDSNKPAGSGVNDDKMDKLITDDSRTPFADKNSVSDTYGTGIEVTEKTVDFEFVESQQNENSGVV